MNLAFIAIERVPEAYQYVLEEVHANNFSDELSQFIVYFERTFIGNHTVNSLFDLNFWSCYNSVLSEIP